MSDGKLKRKLGPWETVQRWLSIGAVASILATIGVFLSAQLDQSINGMSYLGFLYGLLAVLCTIITMLYSQKKRRWFGRAPEGSMMSWLFSHVTIGLIGLVFAVFHIGVAWQNIGLNLSWMLFLSFFVVVVSGIWWRIVYHKLPKSRQSSIRNYSLSYSQGRAQAKRVELEKLRAGCSATFHSLTEAALNGESISEELVRQLTQKERQIWQTFQERLEEMRKHEARFDAQVQTHIGLHLWRLIHIPASLAMIVLLPMHVIGGIAEIKYVNNHSGNFESAEACASCHTQIYEDWSESMHAHALMSPTNLVQTRADMSPNQEVYKKLYGHSSSGTLTDDVGIQSVCVNCHSPLAVQVLGYDDPVQPLNTEHPAAKEGVTCVVCHQYKPKSSYGDKQLSGKEFPGYAINSGVGSWEIFRSGIGGGRTMYSFSREHSGSNLYHDVEYIGEADGNPYAQDSSHFCASCHNVHIDRSALGMGALKLQSIYDEWREQGSGAQGACLDCHAEPGRSHQFIGVDYPLDKPDVIAKTRSHREYLLKDAISIELSNIQNHGGWRGLSFDVTFTNRNVGHNFPAGFAFARQSWLEVVVHDERGSALFESGVLRNESEDDLCDQHTMNGALAEYVQGCAKPDTKLINLQFILSDEHGNETPLQHATGSVQKERIQSLMRSGVCSGSYPMALGESMTCTMHTGVSASKAASVDVKFKLRNLPPYFIRAMNDLQPSGSDYIDLNRYIPNLEVMTIDQVRSRL